MTFPTCRNEPPIRVLLVDDDPYILFLLERIITSRGWEALSASSGTEALALAERADALVTDMRMPGLNGIQLIQALRGRGETLPAILLSAELSQETEAQALAAGAVGCMEKPFRIDELLATIDAALSSRDAERAAPRELSRRAPLVAA